MSAITLGELQALYTAEDRQLQDVSRRVDQSLERNARTADKTTREISQAYNRAGSAIQNLLGRVPGGGRLSQLSSLKADIDDLSLASKGAAGSAGGLSGALDSVGGKGLLAAAGAATAAVGITAVATAAVSASRALIDLVEQTSDEGSEIFELSQKANISAETLSVLGVQARESGSDLASAGASVVKFSNSLVDAARDNKQLREDLKLFGIDAKTAFQEPEKTLIRFIDSFNRLPASSVRNEAAMRLFKDRTGEVIPVLASMESGFDAARQATEEMGALWTGQAAADADRYGDKLTALQGKVAGLAKEFAQGAMPQIESALDGLSGALSENETDWHKWGGAAGAALRDAVSVAQWASPLLRQALLGPFEGLAQYYKANAPDKPGTPQEARAMFPGLGNPMFGMLGRTLDIGPAVSTLPPAPRAPGGGGSRKKAGKTDEQEAQEQLAKLSRELEVLGDNSRRASVETDILSGKFKNATEATRERLKATANLIDVTRDSAAGWEAFQRYAQGAADSLAGGVTPLQEFERELDKLHNSIVGTDGFVDATKEAAISAARMNAQIATMMELAERAARSLDDLSSAVGPDFPGGKPNVDMPFIVTPPDPEPIQGFERDFRRGLRRMADDVDYYLGGAFKRLFSGDAKGFLNELMLSAQDAMAQFATDLVLAPIKRGAQNLVGKLLGDGAGEPVERNTTALEDLTAAVNANTAARGGVPSLTGAGGGLLGAGASLLGSLFGNNSPLPTSTTSGQSVTEFGKLLPGTTILAVGDKAINESVSSYTMTPQGQRTQVIQARYNRKVRGLNFA